ncbi:MAG: DUF4268 domain-containing protein [Candidatus Poribacteria bacterium]|nr:DUF4268 domain-containing protein [Candidatus Poribacteria bacterium]
MALELEDQELNVGNFRADILCRNVVDGSRVLIENQLEETDHSHLGQILTYAAGLDVHAVIWIAKKFQEEHRAALDRLNEITSENFQYFGVEVKVWKIGNSTCAPQFEIVSKPKDWNRTISLKAQRAASKVLPETPLWVERFWREWSDYMTQIGKPLKSPQSGTWSLLNFDTEHYGSEFYIDAYLINEKKEIGIRLCIEWQSEMKYFYPLKKQRKEIEREFAEPLEWHESLEYEGSRIFLRKTDIDLTDETDWPNQHEWLASKLELFDQVFRPRLKALNTTDWKSVENEDEA